MQRNSAQSDGISYLREAKKSINYCRKYETFDPIRSIDWRASSRTEDILVRIEPKLPRLKLLLCVDLWETMFWPTDDFLKLHDAKSINKFELAVRLALNTAYWALRDGKEVFLGFIPANLQSATQIWRLHSSQDVLSMFDAIIAMQGVVEPEHQPIDVSQLKVDDMFLFSDGFREIKDFSEVLQSLHIEAKQNHFLHTLSSFEVHPQLFAENKIFYAEAKQKALVEVGGKTLKADQYQKELNQWRQNLYDQLKLNLGFESTMVHDKMNIAEILGQ